MGHLTNNLDESINLILKKQKPFETFHGPLLHIPCVTNFHMKRKVATMINVGHVYSRVASKTLKDALSKSNTHRCLNLTKVAQYFGVEEMIT